jgi:hypothetical protein
MVIVLEEEVPAIAPSVICSMYGPEPATTSTVTGPEIPTEVMEDEKAPKV